MFGKSDEKKKQEEEEKLQKKLEEKAEASQETQEDASKNEQKTDDKKDEGADSKKDEVEGLKNMGDVGKSVEPPVDNFSKETKDKQVEKPVDNSPKEIDDGKEAVNQTEKKSAEKPAENAPEKEKPAKEESAEEEKPDAKKKRNPELDKLKKQLETQKETMRSLEEEKEEALKKGDELAGLIEEISNDSKDEKGQTPQQQQAQLQQAQATATMNMEPKFKEMEEKHASQIEELKKTIESLTAKKEEGEKGEEEVAVTMKKMFDKRLKELSDKLDNAGAAPPKKEDAGKPGEVSGGLMAMGGGVEIQNEIDKIKKSIKDIATLLDAFKEEAENRFLAIDREMEVVEHVPDLEDKMKQFDRKLGPENVQRLRMLISTADDLKEEVIPLVVKRTVDQKIEPHEKKVKTVEDSLEKSSNQTATVLSEIDTVKKDIKTLFKFDTRLIKLEEDSLGLKKLIAELRSLIKDLNKEQQKITEDQIKQTMPKMIEAESSNLKKEFAGRFAFIDDKLQSVESQISESHKDVSELSVLKGEFDNLRDELLKLDDEKERIVNRIEDLKLKDADMLDKIEANETPKEVITELDNKTKDILDIREFFVRRSDGLEERINQLDERAIPTMKLNEKVDGLSKEIKDLNLQQKEMLKKIESEKKEFQTVIKLHADEKRKIEEKLKDQKLRVATLLKEYR